LAAADEEPMGTLDHTCDPSGTPDSPKGYLYDLSFIKLRESFNVFMKDTAKMAFVEDYAVLPYNKLIRLLTPDPPFRDRPSEGGTLGPLFGTTIGEAIILSNERLLDKSASEHFTKEYAPSLKFQFSRSILWRTYGNFESLRGWSGSPLELVPDETKRENDIRRVP
jgi:hypothetical protein